MKKYLLSACALLSCISFAWSQAPYFSRLYPNFPGWEITAAQFHPKGGFTAVFNKQSLPWQQEVHRLDANGDINDGTASGIQRIIAEQNKAGCQASAMTNNCVPTAVNNVGTASGVQRHRQSRQSPRAGKRSDDDWHSRETARY